MLSSSALLAARAMSRFATARTPSVLLCTDFDETITQRDTTSLLFQLACSPASTAQQLVTQYVTELDELLKSYEGRWATQQQEHERNFDAEGLREFLRGYAATDLRSTQRVVACLALRGIRRPDIFAAAGAVQLRANCAKTLAAVEQWEVLSTNWSTELVAAALQHAGVATASTQIVSNELKMDEHGVSTGEIDVTVQSPVDKERRVAELRSRQGDEQSVVVFVGDSATDLLAMLEADVGDFTVVALRKSLVRQHDTVANDDLRVRNNRHTEDCNIPNKRRLGRVHLDLRSVRRLAFDTGPLTDDRIPPNDGEEHARVILDGHALKNDRVGDSSSRSDSHACCDRHVGAQLGRRVHVGRRVHHHVALDNRGHLPTGCAQRTGICEPEPLHVELRARDRHARRLDLAPKVSQLVQVEAIKKCHAPEVVEVAKLREELLEVVLRVGLGAGLAAQPLAADLVADADDRVHERHVEEVDPAVDNITDERLGLLGPVQDLLAHGVGHEAAVLLGLVVEHALAQHGAGALVLEVEVHHLVEREGAAHVAVQHEEAGRVALQDLVAEEADAARRAQRLVLAQGPLGPCGAHGAAAEWGRRPAHCREILVGVQVDHTANLLSPTLSSFDFDDDSSEEDSDDSSDQAPGTPLPLVDATRHESEVVTEEDDQPKSIRRPTRTSDRSEPFNPSIALELRDRQSLMHHLNAAGVPGRVNRSSTTGSALEAFGGSSQRMMDGKNGVDSDHSQQQHLMYRIMYAKPSARDIWHARAHPHKLQNVARSIMFSMHLKKEHIFERFFVTGMALSETERQHQPSGLAGYWKPKLLYDYPNRINDPPDESVADFCFPRGVPLMMCTPEQATSIRGVAVSKWFTEIEPLQKHIKEAPETSGYTFRLTGAKGEVLYGFCVAAMKEVPTTDIASGSGAAPKSPRSSWTPSWLGGNLSSPTSKGNRSTMTSKMAPVCYCFTSKFPFYRFHFAVLRAIIENELEQQKILSAASTIETAVEDEEFEIVLRPLLDLAMEFTVYHEENPRLRDQPSEADLSDHNNLISIATKLKVSSVEQRVVLSEDASVSTSKSEDTQAINEPRKRPSQLRKSLSTDDIGNYNASNAWIMDKPMVKSIDASRPKEYDRVAVGDILEAVDSIATGMKILHRARRLKINDPGHWSTARFPSYDFSYQFPKRHSDRWSVGVVLRFLAPDKVVEIMAYLLLEKQVVIMGDSPAKVSAVCTALLLLLAPFQWQSTYIPLLPAGLLDFLHSPVPFLAGCHLLNETSEWSDVCFYDIDRDRIAVPAVTRHLGPTSIPNGVELCRLLRKAKERLCALRPTGKPWYELSDEQDTIITLTMQEAEIFLRDLGFDISSQDLAASISGRSGQGSTQQYVRRLFGRVHADAAILPVLRESTAARSTKSTEALGRVQPTGLAHRVLDGVRVPRENRLQVNELAADAHVLSVPAGLLQHSHLRTPAHHRDEVETVPKPVAKTKKATTKRMAKAGAKPKRSGKPKSTSSKKSKISALPGEQDTNRTSKSNQKKAQSRQKITAGGYGGVAARSGHDRSDGNAGLDNRIPKRRKTSLSDHDKTNAATTKAGANNAAQDDPSNLREGGTEVMNSGSHTHGDDAPMEKRVSKPKKFFFTPAADLALLREILGIQPYAAKHWSKTASYQEVTDHLNEHLKIELGIRTVKEHFFLLVKEFKARIANTKEVGRGGGVHGAQTTTAKHHRGNARSWDQEQKKRKAEQDKSDRLESAGAKLREQALKRRCQRDQTHNNEESGASNESSQESSTTIEEAETTSTSSKATGKPAGVTTVQVNMAAVSFIEEQHKRRDDAFDLLREELRLKQSKAEKEEARWKA
ncbi:hypothetical protein ON010_g1510 [Phytophthora cinnamomi]|nr:hypothetical protein ON010_g1510 [Phytophthora cinnamomi]